MVSAKGRPTTARAFKSCTVATRDRKKVEQPTSLAREVPRPTSKDEFVGNRREQFPQRVSRSDRNAQAGGDPNCSISFASSGGMRPISSLSMSSIRSRIALQNTRAASVCENLLNRRISAS